jgi:hypothetical protein
MMKGFKLNKSECLYAMIVFFVLASMSWAALPRALENKLSPATGAYGKSSGIRQRISTARNRFKEKENLGKRRNTSARKSADAAAGVPFEESAVFLKFL